MLNPKLILMGINSRSKVKVNFIFTRNKKLLYISMSCVIVNFRYVA